MEACLLTASDAAGVESRRIRRQRLRLTLLSVAFAGMVCIVCLLVGSQPQKPQQQEQQQPQQQEQQQPHEGGVIERIEREAVALMAPDCVWLAQGKYHDNNGEHFRVSVHDCMVRFEYQGVSMRGRVRGHRLHVHGWAPGTISESTGTVTFDDQGWWRFVGTPCVSTNGPYTDTKGGYFAEGWRRLGGNVRGNVVIITTSGSENEGTVEGNGAVQFPGGYSWFRGWCERYTGGTCIIRNCDEMRRATCMSSFLLLPMWCECPPVHCADSGGDCHPQGAGSLEDVSTVDPAWVRKYITYGWYLFWALLLARLEIPLAFLFNSFCVGWCNATPGAACRLFSVRGDGERVTVGAFEFGRASPWVDLLQGNLLQILCAIINCILRLGLFHLSQPLGFACVLFAYHARMGEWQLVANVFVSIRELLYFVNALMSLYYAPHMFSYTLGSSFAVSLLYVVSPQYFVAWTLRHQNDALEGYLKCVCFLTILGDLCALAAMMLAFGGAGRGAMWPSLFSLYSLQVASLPGLLFAWARGVFH